MMLHLILRGFFGGKRLEMEMVSWDKCSFPYLDPPRGAKWMGVGVPLFFPGGCNHMGISKNRGSFIPKMDGENNGKAY